MHLLRRSAVMINADFLNNLLAMNKRTQSEVRKNAPLATKKCMQARTGGTPEKIEV